MLLHMYILLLLPYYPDLSVDDFKIKSLCNANLTIDVTPFFALCFDFFGQLTQLSVLFSS